MMTLDEFVTSVGTDLARLFASDWKANNQFNPAGWPMVMADLRNWQDEFDCFLGSFGYDSEEASP